MRPQKRSKLSIDMKTPKSVIAKNLSRASALLLIFITSASQVRAAIIDPSNSKYDTGTYGIDDLAGLSLTAADYILGLTGSLALVMFVYGGATLLVSAGSSDKVSRAKKILVAAIIGLIIVFSSKLIIDTVLLNLGANLKK